MHEMRVLMKVNNNPIIPNLPLNLHPLATNQNPAQLQRQRRELPELSSEQEAPGQGIGTHKFPELASATQRAAGRELQHRGEPIAARSLPAQTTEAT